METSWSQNTKAPCNVTIFQNTHLAMNNNFKYLLKMDWADTVDHENKETDQHGKFPQLQV